MKTHTGSCHCKAVRFEVELDVAKATRCNCSVCMKLGSMGCIVKPAAFRLLAGDESLTKYPNQVGERRFCKTCGVFCYGSGHLAEIGGDGEAVGLAGQRVEEVLRAGGQDDLHPVARESLRDRPADASAGSRDDGCSRHVGRTPWSAAGPLAGP